MEETLDSDSWTRYRINNNRPFGVCQLRTFWLTISFIHPISYRHYDSFGHNNPELVAIYSKYLTEESKRWCGSKFRVADETVFDNMRRQENFADCGVFVMMAAYLRTICDQPDGKQVPPLI